MKSFKFIILFQVLLLSSVFAMDYTAKPLKLVFMGKTGSGKSTTINAFYNFAKNISCEAYPKYFPTPSNFEPCNVPEYLGRYAEDHTRGQLGAVTQKTSEYLVRGNNLVLSLIDCPGTADPRGIDKDNENSLEIVRFLAQTGGDFNAVCIVLHGSINRATAEEIYAIEQIKTVIPKSSRNRVFIVLTHASRVSQNVKDFVQAVGLPIDNIFAFDHLALSKEGYVNLNDNEDLAGEISLSWEIAQKAFDKLITKAHSLGKYSTTNMAKIGEIKRYISEKICIALSIVDRVEESELSLEEARVNLEVATREHGNLTEIKQFAEKTLREAQKELETATTTCRAKVCYPAGNILRFHENSIPCPISTRQFNARVNYVVILSDFRSKEGDLILKTGEKDRLSAILNDIKSCLDNLKREKTELQHQIVELYVELDKVSMGSISFHIGEYYNLCIQNADSLVKKSKLEKDRKFYTEQVELYKRRTGNI